MGKPVSTSLVSGVTFDGTGQLVSRTYGNDVVRAMSYDPVTCQLSGLSASFASGTVETPTTTYVQSDTFTRDALGRITQIASAVPNGGTGATASEKTGQCFTYNGFNRLKWAWTIAGTGPLGACGTTDPTGVVGSDASPTTYATWWDYSKSGAINHIVNRVVTDGVAAPVTATLTYGGVGTPASGVTTMDDGSATHHYTYDGAGRQVTRTVDTVGKPSTTTNLSWDVSSNLVETTGAGGDQVYVYDASGQRVAKIQVPDGSHTGAVTGYLGSTELTDANTASSANADLGADAHALEGAAFITGTRYYSFGGATVAVRQATAGVASAPGTSTLSLVFGDEQGSATVMMPVTLEATTGAMASATAADALAATRNAYTPYGAVRGTDNLSIDHGWLNKIADTVTGLTYLGARYFDPLTSRFISPDPLMNPMDPRTLDAYMYANNNPVMFSDASGLRAVGSGECGIGQSCNVPSADAVWIGKSGGGTGSAGGPGGSGGSGGAGGAGNPGGGGQCSDQACLIAHAESLGIDITNSQSSSYVPPPLDDGSVFYNGNWCIPGSACYEESLNYHHNPAADRALIALLIGDDYHGCVGAGAGFLSRGGHCFVLAMTVIPGVGELGGAADLAKLGKIAKIADEAGDGVKAVTKAENLARLAKGWRATSFGDEAASFEYHYSRHGVPRGVSPEQYAQDALDWAGHPAGLPTRVPLSDGSAGLRYRTPGGGPGGILDLSGNIITFWFG